MEKDAHRHRSGGRLRRQIGLESALIITGASLWVGLGYPSPASAASQPAQGPIAFVTGSTDGLGREVARRLAATGAHVIVHGRNTERGEELVREIAAAGVGSARFYRADFASLAEVRTLAESILRDYDRLDLLVNNAGIWLESSAGRVVSQDGHEMHFQVNYLAGFLLTRSLLPLLRSSAPSRIVNVASLSQTPLAFDDLMLERGYSDGRAYGQSKLAQIIMTVDMAEELRGTGVTVFALHPATYMGTNMVVARGIDPFTTVEEGAAAVLNVIGSSAASGSFFNGMNPGNPNAQARDAEARRRLREISEELTGL